MSTRPMRLSLSLTSLRATHMLRRTTERLSAFAEGLALSGLTDEELGALTEHRYTEWNRKPLGQLAPWETQWLCRDLPPAGARILLGGAGAGRELRWLREAGYDVVAFDPAAPADAGILCMSYEDLWQPAGMPRSAAAAQVRAGAPYDAILLGWGSFTHVAGAARRLQSLRALRDLCSGPLLMSYWHRSSGWGTRAPASRPRRLGQRLGSLLASGEVPDDRQNDSVVSHAGYAHAFSHEELDQLASQCGYRAQHFDDSYPHSTFTPL